MRDLLGRALELPCGQPGGDQGVDQDLEVVLHRGPTHRGVAGDGCDIGYLPVLPSRDLQETAEAAHASRQRLGPDLFLQIRLRIGGQVRGRVVAGDRKRQGAVAERIVEVHLKRPFGGYQRVEVFDHRPPCKQVGAAASQLASARSGQDEPEPSCLDQAMDLVEQLGDALDLIDHHPRTGGEPFDLPKQRGRLARQTQRLGRVQQVVDASAREVSLDPRRLAGTARPNRKHDARGR